MADTTMLWLEALSYITTILGFPSAIFVFIYERRKSLANEKDELHRHLSEEYDNFLRLVLENADLLLLRRPTVVAKLSDEQRERRDVIFRMLVSLFEKAYIILYSEDLSDDARRRWLSWEDDMRDWCRREDFSTALPNMLEGEDDAFSQHIMAVVRAQT